MKTHLLIPLLSIGVASLASASSLIDFDPTGEYTTLFSNSTTPVYTETATGGLNGSIGLTLANAAAATYSGAGSESRTAGTFQAGGSFTVGAFFNLSTLPASTSTTQALRLGLTNGASDTFTTCLFRVFSSKLVELQSWQPEGPRRLISARPSRCCLTSGIISKPLSKELTAPASITTW